MSDLLDHWSEQLAKAVKRFWTQRNQQAKDQAKNQSRPDRSGRRAVTGGKHLDGFRELVVSIVSTAGLQRSEILWQQRTEIPGWFRAEKNWDLLILADRKLIAGIEFKSQVGSFGNNFNNRSEEAIGSATDLWAAYEKGAFQPSERPWLGYFMLLEDAPGSNRPVGVKEPHFAIFPEFREATYAMRYELLLTKLIRSRLYDAACFLMSSRESGRKGIYREPNEELSFRNLVTSLLGHMLAVAKLQPQPSAEEPKTKPIK